MNQKPSHSFWIGRSLKEESLWRAWHWASVKEKISCSTHLHTCTSSFSLVVEQKDVKSLLHTFEVWAGYVGEVDLGHMLLWRTLWPGKRGRCMIQSQVSIKWILDSGADLSRALSKMDKILLLHELSLRREDQQQVYTWGVFRIVPGNICCLKTGFQDFFLHQSKLIF